MSELKNKVSAPTIVKNVTEGFKNSKTTTWIAVVSVAVILLLQIAVPLLNGDKLDSRAIATIVIEILTAIGLVAARDNSVSSEQALAGEE